MKDLQVTLNITHETFRDEKGNVRPYVAFKFELDGETFAVSIKDNDKKLLNYILRKKGFYDEDKDVIA